MAGTFEIVFSGLCLFVFSPMDGPPKEVAVNLVRTDKKDMKTFCEDGGQHIPLHRHDPELIIQVDSWVTCSAMQQGSCSPTDMPSCSVEKDVVTCDLEGRELCVRTASTQHELAVAEGSGTGAPTDPRSPAAKAFNWIAHLRGIGGEQIKGLKQQVTEDPLQATNPLVVSRIRSSHGWLATKALGKKGGSYVIWQVRPSGSYPLKALAEHLSLTLKDLGKNAVRLEDCQHPLDYFWEFKPTVNETVQVVVQNEAEGQCDYYGKSPPHDDCTVSTATHPNRLRHYLWYYELVEWNGGTCPKYLPAPVCPGGNCLKQSAAELTEVPLYIRTTDNTLCPPSKFP